MFKLGLTTKGKGPNNAGKPAPGKRKPLLGDDDEDDVKDKSKATPNEENIGEFTYDAAAASTSKPTKPAPGSKSKVPPAGPPTRKVQAKDDDPSHLLNSASTRESERKAKEAEKLDPSIYDYDAAYDAIHARQAAKKAAEQEERQQPKYMENLIESAEIRKRDQLRARDKLLRREREAEGDEFADKEKFVTGAYKAQQEEARKAEEEENKRQEIEEEKRRKTGMQGFHRQMLLDEEKRHQEAMEAAADLAKKGIKVESLDERERLDADLIKKAQAEGKNIKLTDDGQVADKRQLLGAGLNIVAKPKSATAAPATSARPVIHQNSYQVRNASGRKDQRERQTQMIAEQIEQAAKRAADDEAEERRKLEHASKSRKTEGDISSAKERYLQRKREAAAAKAAAGK